MYYLTFYPYLYLKLACKNVIINETIHLNLDIQDTYVSDRNLLQYELNLNKNAMSKYK